MAEPLHVVVTGAGGFVGSRLVQQLHARGAAITGIGRSEAPPGWPSGARWIQADIADPNGYETTLGGAACVIHLAALTGKARPEEFQHANEDATAALLAASARAGVERFVFVSTIAVTFADRRHYAYAESKIAAEALVRGAPIPSVIVRPTMILGPGSSIEASLSRLARLPLAPIFGDGKRMVQPIDVEDVAAFLAALAYAQDVRAETADLGGPETYDLRALYTRLRGGAGAPRLLHLPLGLARWFLAMVEKPLLPLLPLTAGQLASFANDGVAAAHPVVARLLPRPRTTPRAAQADAPSPTDAVDLQQEARRFIAYAVDAAANDYQVGKYVDFHRRRNPTPSNAFDALMLRLARSSWLGLALADAYSGVLMRTGLIRRKLVLALAIAEASGPSARSIDRPDPGGRLVVVKLALRAAVSTAAFIVSVVALGPLHLLLGRRSAASR